MSTLYGGPYGRNDRQPRRYQFWKCFNEFYHSTLDIDEAMHELSHHAVDSARYVECSMEIDRLAEAAYSILGEMTGLVGDAPDEKAALLASAAQYVPAQGFDAIPEAALVIHQLARNSAGEISDPDFREMVGALLDRLEPGYGLADRSPDDEDDDLSPVPGL